MGRSDGIDLCNVYVNNIKFYFGFRTFWLGELGCLAAFTALTLKKASIKHKNHFRPALIGSE
ncbi:MAG TPA: hypothetical protein DDW65_23245 [Firmicutes bacterium]|jgi:hypothetical protein|nr:hypothetical protein [Bacillota bacterium]